MSMIGIGNQEFFAMYATFGFTGHVQVLVRTNMKIYKNDEPWYCRPCKINLFPYFELTNNQLIKLHENNKTKNQNKDYNTFSNSQKISIVCSIVQKGVSAPFLFSFPLSVETCNPHPYPTPLDTTHHRKIPDSMMIHWNEGYWKQLI